MSNKTLENLVRQSDNSFKAPFELWKQRDHRSYRPSAAALARRASLDAALSNTVRA